MVILTDYDITDETLTSVLADFIIRMTACPMHEEFEDIKGVIRIRISKKKDNRMARRKSTKDKQRSTKHIHKTKDRVTRTLLKRG